ncbi:MAG: leucine-rich repeat domain-containing protein, partial [Anaeroplasmataceae bacterium]|nr:leucine-rich repeat domain-containing protein [Anaeroplasmataceae bacterium]
YMFENDKILEHVDLTSTTISSVAVGAFKECHSLIYLNSTTEFILNPSITLIEEYAFYGLRELAELNIPSNIIELESYSFAYLTSIETLVLPDTLQYIHKGAFNGMCELEDLTLPFIGSSLSAVSGTEESLFGWIFGSDAYTDYPDGYDAIHSEAHGVKIVQGYKEDDETSGWTFYIPYKLYRIDLSSQITDIAAYAFQNVHMVDVINIPLTTQVIRTRAFDGCWDLKYVEIPIGLLELHEQVFINMESPEELAAEAQGAGAMLNGELYEQFFIVAHYVPSYAPAKDDNSIVYSMNRPSKWHLTADDSALDPTDLRDNPQFVWEQHEATRWHTKYIVYSEDREIFIYQYNPNAIVNPDGTHSGGFEIIGYTPRFVGGHIVVPELYAGRPVVAIRENAIASYAQKADADPNDIYRSIDTFEIAYNVVTVEANALPGGDAMIVYVHRTKDEASDYCGGNTKQWIGSYDSETDTTDGLALVYFGYVDTTSVDAEDLTDNTKYMEKYSWTKTSGDAYQILINGLDITWENSELVYTGDEQKPTPIVSLNDKNTTIVGNVENESVKQKTGKQIKDEQGHWIDEDPVRPILPNLTVEGNLYKLVYEDNLHITGFSETGQITTYQPRVTLVSNNYATTGNQTVEFDIVKAELVVSFEDSKVFDESRWENSSWTDQVSGYVGSTGGQLYGTLVTTGNNTVEYYKKDNSTFGSKDIVYVDGADARTYSSNDELYNLMWSEMWYVLSEDNQNITMDYYVTLKDITVVISPMIVMTYWNDLTQEYSDTNLLLPTVTTMYDAAKLPLKVSALGEENSNTLGMGSHTAYVTVDTTKILPDTHGNVAVNYILIPSTNSFTIKKITVPIPVVGTNYGYTGEPIEIYAQESAKGLYKLYTGTYTEYNASNQILAQRGMIADDVYLINAGKVSVVYT